MLSKQRPVRARDRRRSLVPPTKAEFSQIAALIRQTAGVDLRAYKSPTIQRRVLRRVTSLKLPSVAAYIKRLKDDKKEAATLYEDSLIHVTSFFRDPTVFQALCKSVVPALLKNHKGDRPIRCWVPGCSTGEEVYTIAISLMECLQKAGKAPPLHIFGTDVSEPTLAFARKGLYPKSIAKHVGPQILLRYFTPTADGYQVNKNLRAICTFARQDIVQDPPFSRLDLISCRNLLIYLSPEIQNRIVNVFHYALNPSGFLVMGKSETIGAFFPEFFSTFDKRNNIYAKRPSTIRPSIGVQLSPTAVKPTSPRAYKVIEQSDVPVHREAERILLSHFSPPSALINGALEVVHTNGDLTPYLRLAAGKPSLNILKLARENLMVELRLAIERARRTGRPFRKRGLAISDGRRRRSFTLHAIPLDMPVLKERYHLVAFEDEPSPLSLSAIKAVRDDQRGRDPKTVTHLRQELAATKNYLHSIMEEHEQVTQQLRSANEEILSSNEELQSTNEEMETAKEELESTNEELTTVNEELASRNAELKESMAALEERKALLKNAQAIAHIGSWAWEPATDKISWSDELYRIYKLNLDRKPLKFSKFISLVHPDDRATCEKHIKRAIEKKSTFQFEHRIVRTDGEVRILHARGEMVLDGRGRIVRVVGTGQDITEKRQAEEALRRAHDELELRVQERTKELAAANQSLRKEVSERQKIEEALRRSERMLIDFYESAPVGILWVDAEGRASRVNEAFLQLIGSSALRTVGRRVREFFTDPSTGDAVLERLRGGETVDSLEVELDHADGSRRWGSLSANAQSGEDGRLRIYRWFVRDITERRAAAAALSELAAEVHQRNEELASSNADLEQFAYVTSHDLQEPLRRIYTYLDLIKTNLASGNIDVAKARANIERIQSSALRMRTLIEDLLNFSRIKRLGQEKEKVDLNVVLREVQYDLEARIQSTGAKIEASRLPTVMGNPVQMRQLFQNLLGNSLKFVAPGVVPSVDIKYRREGKWHEVSVADNGIGFEQQYVDRIFKPFQRLHKQTDFEGTGIGLAICLKILHQHGGTISAKSAPGSGATFTVRLPAANGSTPA